MGSEKSELVGLAKDRLTMVAGALRAMLMVEELGDVLGSMMPEGLLAGDGMGNVAAL